MASKKEKVIEELYKICKKKNDYVFHNDIVKDVCKRIGFGNPFDVTKLDNKAKLPEILKKNDLAIIHIGNGKHKFIKGIKKVYHDFEPIQKTITWYYRKSLLNHYNSSESNILSVANNQRILHHFILRKILNLKILIYLKDQRHIFLIELKHLLSIPSASKQNLN